MIYLQRHHLSFLQQDSKTIRERIFKFTICPNLIYSSLSFISVITAQVFEPHCHHQALVYNSTKGKKAVLAGCRSRWCSKMQTGTRACRSRDQVV